MVEVVGSYLRKSNSGGIDHTSSKVRFRDLAEVSQFGGGETVLGFVQLD